jgi:hypothetical protein
MSLQNDEGSSTKTEEMAPLIKRSKNNKEKMGCCSCICCYTQLEEIDHMNTPYEDLDVQFKCQKVREFLSCCFLSDKMDELIIYEGELVTRRVAYRYGYRFWLKGYEDGKEKFVITADDVIRRSKKRCLNFGCCKELEEVHPSYNNNRADKVENYRKLPYLPGFFSFLTCGILGDDGIFGSRRYEMVTYKGRAVNREEAYELWSAEKEAEEKRKRKERVEERRRKREEREEDERVFRLEEKDLDYQEATYKYIAYIDYYYLRKYNYLRNDCDAIKIGNKTFQELKKAHDAKIRREAQAKLNSRNYTNSVSNQTRGDYRSSTNDRDAAAYRYQQQQAASREADRVRAENERRYQERQRQQQQEDYRRQQQQQADQRYREAQQAMAKMNNRGY